MNARVSSRAALLLLLLALPVLADPAPPALELSPAPRITLDLRDVDLRDALRSLSAQAGTNVAAEEGVQGRVTVRLGGVTFEEALRAILGLGGFRAEFRDGVWWIRKGTPSVLVRRDDLGLLEVEVRGADVREALAEVASSTGFNVVPGPDVTGTVTVVLRNVTASQAIERLAQAGGFAVRQELSTFHVYAPPPPEAPPPPGPIRVDRAEDGTVTVDASAAPLAELLARLAREAGGNVVLDAAVAGQATVHLEGIEPAKALRDVAEAHGYRVETVDGVARVGLPVERPPFDVSVVGGKVTLRAQSADARAVFGRLAEATGLDVVLAPSVEGPVTLHVSDVRPEAALEALTRARGLELTREGERYVLADPAKMVRLRVAGTAETLDVEARNVPIRDLLAEIGRAAGVNAVAAPGVEGTATLSLRGLSARRVVEEAAASAGYGIVEADGILRVVRREDVPPPPAPPLLPPTPLDVAVEGGRLTIDVTDADLPRLVRAVSERSGMNLVAEQGTAEAKVSGRLTDVPLEDGLRTLLAANGLRLSRSGAIYRIAPVAAAAGAGQAAAAPAFDVSIDDSGLLSIRAEEADLGALLREVAARTGINLLVYGSVRQATNVSVEGLPLETALSRLLEGTPYGWNVRDDVYLVGEKAPGSATASAISREEVIPIQYLSAADVPGLLPPSVPAAAVKVITERNAISVNAPVDVIEQVRRSVASIDRAPTNVAIDALVVEYRDNADYQYNLSMTATGALGGQISLAPASDAGELTTNVLNTATLGEFSRPSFDVALRYLITEGRASIKASPAVTTISGKEATVRVAQDEFFRVTTPSGNANVPLTQLEKIASGITLKITPYVNDRGDQVTLQIFVEDSSAGDRTADGLPAIATRSASTRVTLRPGETLVLGGLVRETTRRAEGRVPGLGRMPLLGWLFRNRTQEARFSTLAFYISPRVSAPTTVPADARPEGAAPTPPLPPVPDRRADDQGASLGTGSRDVETARVGGAD